MVVQPFILAFRIINLACPRYIGPLQSDTRWCYYTDWEQSVILGWNYSASSYLKRSTATTIDEDTFRRGISVYWTSWLFILLIFLFDAISWTWRMSCGNKGGRGREFGEWFSFVFVRANSIETRWWRCMIRKVSSCMKAIGRNGAVNSSFSTYGLC